MKETTQLFRALCVVCTLFVCCLTSKAVKFKFTFEEGVDNYSVTLKAGTNGTVTYTVNEKETTETLTSGTIKTYTGTFTTSDRTFLCDTQSGGTLSIIGADWVPGTAKIIKFEFIDSGFSTNTIRLSGNDFSQNDLDLSKNSGIVSLYLNNCNLRAIPKFAPTVISNNKLNRVEISGNLNILSNPNVTSGKVFDFSFATNTNFGVLKVRGSNVNNDNLVLPPATAFSTNNNSMDIANNNLTVLNLPDYPMLQRLYINGNQINELRLPSDLSAIVDFYINNNSMNFRTLPALPAKFPNVAAPQCGYFPQKAVAIAENTIIGTSIIDLSSIKRTNGNTTYQWFAHLEADTTTMVEGTDYQIVNSDQFKFINNALNGKKAFCKIRNSLFDTGLESQFIATSSTSLSTTTAINGTANQEFSIKVCEGKLYFENFNSDDTYRIISYTGAIVGEKAIAPIVDLPSLKGAYIVLAKGRSLGFVIR